MSVDERALRGNLWRAQSVTQVLKELDGVESSLSPQMAIHALRAIAATGGRVFRGSGRYEWFIDTWDTRQEEVPLNLDIVFQRVLSRATDWLTGGGSGFRTEREITQALSHLTWVLTRLCMADTQVFKSISALSLPRLAAFSSHDLSVLMWGFAKMGYVHGELYDRASEVVLSRLPHSFSPADIGQLTYSFKLADQYIRTKWDGSTSDERGFAVFGMNMPHIVRGLMVATDRQLPLFRPSDLGTLSVSISEMKHHLHKGEAVAFVESLVSFVISSHGWSALDNKAFSNAAFAMATHHERRAPVNHTLWEGIAKELVGRADRLPARDLANVCWSLARVNCLTADIVTAIQNPLNKAAANSYFDTPSLANVIWALGRANCTSSKIHQRLEQLADSHVKSLTPGQLCGVAWGFMKSSHVPSVLFQKLAKRALMIMHECKAQHLCCLAHVWRQRMHWENAPLVHLLASQVAKQTVRCDRMAPSEVVPIAHFLAKYNMLLDVHHSSESTMVHHTSVATDIMTYTGRRADAFGMLSLAGICEVFVGHPPTPMLHTMYALIATKAAPRMSTFHTDTLMRLVDLLTLALSPRPHNPTPEYLFLRSAMGELGSRVCERMASEMGAAVTPNSQFVAYLGTFCRAPEVFADRGLWCAVWGELAERSPSFDADEANRALECLTSPSRTLRTDIPMAHTIEAKHVVRVLAEKVMQDSREKRQDYKQRGGIATAISGAGEGGTPSHSHPHPHTERGADIMRAAVG